MYQRWLDFTVKQEHIDEGIQQDNSACAVWYALETAVRGLNLNISHIKVTPTEISFLNKDTDERYTYQNPTKVRAFVDTFDIDRSKVEPFDGRLDLLNPDRVKPKTYRSPKRKLQSRKANDPSNPKTYVSKVGTTASPTHRTLTHKSV